MRVQAAQIPPAQRDAVPVEEIQEGIKHGVRKINIDTDNRLAMTAAIPGTDLQSDPMGYGTLVRAHIDHAEVIALAPHGVLPEHQGEGAGTALVNALLQKAQADGEEVVVVYGWPEYYAKFGFHQASEHGVHAAFARQPEALQILTLQDGAEVPACEFRYPPAFGAENAQVAGR